MIGPLGPLDGALLLGAVVSVAAASAAGIACLGHPAPARVRWLRAATAAGLVLLGALLAKLGLAHGVLPATNRGEFLLLLAAVLLVSALLFEISLRLTALAAWVAIFALGLLGLGSALLLALPPAAAASPAGVLSPDSARTAAHIAIMTLAYVALTLGFLSGGMYLAAERDLKSHRRGWVLRSFPALESLAALNRRAAGIGFLLLTIGIVTGYLEARSRMPGPEWRLDAKILLSTATWAVYGAVLVLHRFAALRGRRFALATAAGFAFVVLTFLVSKFVQGSFHAF